MAQQQEPAAAVGTDLPLCGIRVLDVASFIAAPVAATVPATTAPTSSRRNP